MIEGFYISQNAPASLTTVPEGKRAMTREEHLHQEQTIRSTVPFRMPRRSQTLHDYKVPLPPFQNVPETRTIYVQSRPDAEKSKTEALLEQIDTLQLGTIAEESSKSAVKAAPRRPPLPPPRRSYSVMEDEPLPAMNSPLSRLALCDLPGELHYAIFDFLDPIDSACLGLTSKHYYSIHRRLHGSVPLSVRRSGPNDMEWTWHLACKVVERRGPEDLKEKEKAELEKLLVSPASPEKIVPTSPVSLGGTGDLSRLRIKGQALCRKCGVSRCELHKHIGSWMGEGYEYCSVRETFGRPAGEDARSSCYMSNPKNRSRCGRHRDRK